MSNPDDGIFASLQQISSIQYPVSSNLPRYAMKNRYLKSSFLLLSALFLIPSGLQAHGVKGSIDKGGVIVTARYDTDEPMSYAKATIRPPGGGLDFQTGRTDRNGRFCFFPDGSGNWEIIVDDGMGHRLKMVVPVNQELASMEDERPAPSTANSSSKLEKAVMGVCIIFGISGCLLWWRGRKPDSRPRQDWKKRPTEDEERQ